MLLSKQIREVMKQAKCSAHEAAEALGVDIDASTMAEIADSGGVFTLEKIVKEGQLKAAKVLVDIIEDPAAENKDRIAASKIILLGAG
jgi:EAL domain-containing protein (putative c-di-GMP-specific phosphodiesterase class I)